MHRDLNRYFALQNYLHQGILAPHVKAAVYSHFRFTCMNCKLDVLSYGSEAYSYYNLVQRLTKKRITNALFSTTGFADIWAEDIVTQCTKNSLLNRREI